LLPLVLVRILPAEDVGQYKVFFLYLVLIPWLFLSAGISNGLSHWAGYSEEQARKAFRASWTALVALAAIALVACLAASPWLARSLEWSQCQVVLFVWGAIFTMLAPFYEEARVARGEVWKGAVFSSSFDFARNLSILCAAVAFRDVDAVFLTYALVMTLKVAAGAWSGARASFLGVELGRETWAPVLKYAMPVSLSAVLAIITGYVDQLILSHWIPAAQFAVYSLGCTVIPPLMVFEQSVTRVLIPRMSAAFNQGQGARAAALYRNAAREMGWLFIPAAAGLVVFAEPIVRLLFTDKFIDAVPFFRLQALNYLSFLLPLDAVARARGNGRWILGNLALFAVLSTLSCATLTMAYGATGALVGVISMHAVMRFFAASWVRRSEKWKVRDFVPGWAWARYALLSVALLIAALLTRGLFSDDRYWFLVTGPAITLVYLAATLPGLMRMRRLESGQLPRVMMLTQYLSVGGLERMIYNLASQVKKDGNFEPLVFAYDRIPGVERLDPLFEEAGIAVESFDKKPGFSLRAVIRIVQRAHAHRVSVLHSHDLGALIYAVAAKVLSLGSLRVVHTQHSFVHLTKSRWYIWYERVFTLFVDRLTVVSDEARRLYAEEVLIPGARIEQINNGVRFPEAMPLAAVERADARRRVISGVTDPEARARLEGWLDRVWVLCMARVHPRKGQEHVLEVWDRLPAEDRARAALIFVGPETEAGALDKLRARLEATRARLGGDAASCLYAGFTLAPMDWLVASDVYVSGSEYEGMPIAPIEAVGAGLRVLVSDIPGHSMINGAGVTRYPLDRPETGAAFLSEMVRFFPPAAVSGTNGSRALLWEAAQEWRHKFGTPGMSLAYQRLYSAVISDDQLSHGLDGR
jgi:O-antigen/teichoic acid export membrane protein/glycosyltransferase involved in cell wall biosynthesis